MDLELDFESQRRFQPTDEFLLRVLLRLASGRNVIPCSDMVELDLYGPGKEPWKLFAGDQEIRELHNVGDPARKVREKYIISKIYRIGKTNVSRTAGAGTWVDKSTAKDVNIGESVMGHHRTLNYEYCGGDGAAEGKNYYYLHEFQLSSQAMQLLNIPSFDYVVCRVLKDMSKACRIGRKRKFDPQPDCPPLPHPKRPKVVIELHDDDEAGQLDTGPSLDIVEPPLVVLEPVSEDVDLLELLLDAPETDIDDQTDFCNLFSSLPEFEEDWKYLTGFTDPALLWKPASVDIMV